VDGGDNFKASSLSVGNRMKNQTYAQRVGQIGNVEKSFFASPVSSAARLSCPAQQGAADAATARERLDGKHLITLQNRLRRPPQKRPICGRIMAVRYFGPGGAVTQHRRSRLLAKASR
jgi:hypothetical protein